MRNGLCSFFFVITFVVVQFTCSKAHLFQVCSLVSVANDLLSVAAD